MLEILFILYLVNKIKNHLTNRIYFVRKIGG